MTISPGTNSNDPRFYHNGNTPARRPGTGGYYAMGDELSVLTKRATRLLNFYEQAHPTDPNIAAYLPAQVPGQVGGDVDIRSPLHVGCGYNISVGDSSWVDYGPTVFDVAPVVIGMGVLIGPNCLLYTMIRPNEPGPR